MYALIASLLPEGKIGAVVFTLMLFPLSEFLFELMEQVANGEEFGSNSKKLFSTENKGMFFKLWLTYVFIVVLLYKTVAIFGEVVGYPIAAFFIFGMPASLIILMMEKNVFSMIDPTKISYIIKLFGGSYLLLYVIAVISISVSLQFSVMANPNHFVVELLANMFSIYFIIVLFSMMGYLVFQHHYELNYKVRINHLTALRQQKNNEMTEVDIFLQEGRFEDAQKLLLRKISENAMDYRSNEKLILLYAVQGNECHMTKIANEYFVTLINANKVSQAADFFHALSKKSINYVPKSSVVAITLAKKMSNLQQYSVALLLLNNYSCEPSKEKNWDQIAYVKAKLLAEFEHDNPNSIRLLDMIIKRSIDQDLLILAEKLREILIS